MHGRNCHFCGREGIALRGNRDNWKHVKDAPDENSGNWSREGIALRAL